MDDIKNNIESRKLHIVKSFIDNSLSQDNLKKGKALPIGTIRTHGGKKVIKTAQGWRPYSEGGKHHHHVESQKTANQQEAGKKAHKVKMPGEDKFRHISEEDHQKLSGGRETKAGGRYHGTKIEYHGSYSSDGSGHKKKEESAKKKPTAKKKEVDKHAAPPLTPSKEATKLIENFKKLGSSNMALGEKQTIQAELRLKHGVVMDNDGKVRIGSNFNEADRLLKDIFENNNRQEAVEEAAQYLNSFKLGLSNGRDTYFGHPTESIVNEYQRVLDYAKEKGAVPKSFHEPYKKQGQGFVNESGELELKIKKRQLSIGKKTTDNIRNLEVGQSMPVGASSGDSLIVTHVEPGIYNVEDMHGSKSLTCSIDFPDGFDSNPKGFDNQNKVEEAPTKLTDAQIVQAAKEKAIQSLSMEDAEAYYEVASEETIEDAYEHGKEDFPYLTDSGVFIASGDNIKFNNSGYERNFSREEVRQLFDGKNVRGFRYSQSNQAFETPDEMYMIDKNVLTQLTDENQNVTLSDWLQDQDLDAIDYLHDSLKPEGMDGIAADDAADKAFKEKYGVEFKDAYEIAEVLSEGDMDSLEEDLYPDMITEAERAVYGEDMVDPTGEYEDASFEDPKIQEYANNAFKKKYGIDYNTALELIE